MNHQKNANDTHHHQFLLVVVSLLSTDEEGASNTHMLRILDNNHDKMKIRDKILLDVQQHRHPQDHHHHSQGRAERGISWTALLTVFGFIAFVVFLSLDKSGYEITAIGDALAKRYESTYNPPNTPANRQDIKPRGNAPIAGKLFDATAYYHCPAGRVEDGDGGVRNLVLLHGSKFTHECWKDSGVLAQLCQIGTLQVTAVDFSVRSGYKQLQQMLDTLKDSGLVTSLPVDVLVTPSASGKSVLNWLEQDDKTVRTLPDYVKAWMPIGVLSVNKATPRVMDALRDLVVDGDEDGKRLSVVAIHGDGDIEGGKSSETLRQNVDGVSIVELKGPHAVYFESPDDFVMTILKTINEMNQ